MHLVTHYIRLRGRSSRYMLMLGTINNSDSLNDSNLMYHERLIGVISYDYYSIVMTKKKFSATTLLF